MTWLHRLFRRPARFRDWDEFSLYFKGLGDGLMAAGLPEAALELTSHLKAGEAPMSGYYVRLAGVIDGILRREEGRLPGPLAAKLREASARLTASAC